MLIHLIILYILIGTLITTCIYIYNTKTKNYDKLYTEKCDIEEHVNKIERIYSIKLERLRKETDDYLQKKNDDQIKKLKIDKINTLQEFANNNRVFTYLRQDIISSFLTLFPSNSIIFEKIFNTKNVEICIYNAELYISLQLNNCKYFLLFRDYLKIISKISKINTIEELEILFKDFKCITECNYITLPT